MCSNGINTGQFDEMIEQINDHIALEYRWVHKLAHKAGDAGYTTVDDKLHEAQMMLADVRAKLDEAREALESDARKNSGVTAHLV